MTTPHPTPGPLLKQRFKFPKPVRQTFKFPKPAKIVASRATHTGGTKLNHLTYFWLRHIALFLSPDSYLAFIGTCKDIRKLGDDQTLHANHARDVAYILSLIFDLKRNVFIYGSAGSGKTYILNKIYDWACKLQVKTVMTATTGIASINLRDGRTLHSFSGLRKGTIPLDRLEEQLKNSEFKIPNLWRTTQLLICDEISMNGARFLGKLNLVGQYARNSSRPLGGLPVVLTGDLMQLPPVADKFPFTSPIWHELDLVPVRLRFAFRQNQDLTYYKFLQRIRMGEHTEDDLQFLEERYAYTMAHKEMLDNMAIKPTRLLSKQKDVQAINAGEFAKLESPIEIGLDAEDYVVTRIIEGKKSYYQASAAMSLDEARTILKGRAEHQAPQYIEFREGAQYILTFNFDIKGKHVNGSGCVYKQGGKVQFIDGSEMTLGQCRHTFHYPIGSNLFLSRTQVALRYGWASTLHGSQGRTLDRIRIDLGLSIFCAAQAYVGLSRVRTAEGLYIDNFDRRSIKTHGAAKKYMKKLEKLTQRISLNDINMEEDSDDQSCEE